MSAVSEICYTIKYILYNREKTASRILGEKNAADHRKKYAQKK